MKLPIPLLLYTASLGLLGVSGWTVYKLLPVLKKESRDAATQRGMEGAISRLSMGRGQGPVSADWRYGNSAWWSEFKAANFLGKLPPPPPKPKDVEEAVQAVQPKDVKPLEQILEIVTLVYDGKDLGQGELSHAIVRYRPEANVQPPEWYMRETATATSAAGAGPRDTTPPPRQGGNPGGPTGRQNNPRTTQPARGPSSALPTSLVGKEVLQKVWIQGGDDPRREPRLWPPFQDIRLVRVDPSAQVAYFTRTPPSPKNGEPAAAPQEEALAKSSLGLSAELILELQRLQGKRPDATAGARAPLAAATDAGVWQEVEETTLINNVRHIGRQQERRLRDNPDELMQRVHMDTYVSKFGSTRGLQVRSVDPQIASEFGIIQGDVLIEVNGRPVRTQAEAMRFGEGEYQKGVRTFVTKWLSGGQVVERTYQARNQ
jgi:hypothetical protein